MASPRPLLAIRLPPRAAAEAVRAGWDSERAVLPLDPTAPEDDVRRTLVALRPTHLLDEHGERPRADGVGVPAEVAAVVATSGTTGTPRGVELTWTGMAASASAVSKALEVGPGDAWLCCLPLHHVAGLAIVARSWVTGTRLVVARFDAATFGAHGATLVSLVPVALRRALDVGADFTGFRHVLVGGAPVADDLRRRAEAAGASVVMAYGLTETWSGVVHDGHPLPGVELRLGDDDEIRVRGSMVMRGYRLRPEETAAALDGEGWLRTGDVGAFESDGRLRVIDRLDDMIITGGVNVSPSEVEAVLARHPAVNDVCVAGAPDVEWGERVVAYLVPAGGVGPDLATLREFAAAQLAAPKLPRQVVTLDEIPRTASGKPKRRLLRAGSVPPGAAGDHRRRSGPPPPVRG